MLAEVWFILGHLFITLFSIYMYIFITDTKFEQILAIIKSQMWYAMNIKFQEYLESEWISCKEVSYIFLL